MFQLSRSQYICWSPLQKALWISHGQVAEESCRNSSNLLKKLNLGCHDGDCRELDGFLSMLLDCVSELNSGLLRVVTVAELVMSMFREFGSTNSAST